MARKPLRALKPSDSQLDDLAEITPEDIEHAKNEFRKDADGRWTSLLDAEPVPVEEEDG